MSGFLRLRHAVRFPLQLLRALPLVALITGSFAFTGLAQVFDFSGGEYGFGETSFTLSVDRPITIENLDLYVALQTKSFGSLEDLEITLTSPTGTRVRLAASGALGDVQGFLQGDRLQETRFTADAPMEIEDGTPPYAADYKVDGVSAANGMALFRDESAMGQWILTVRDVAGLGGTIYGTSNLGAAPWTSNPTRLVITIVPPPSTPDLAPESDSGFSNSDNLTNARRLTFTGTAKVNTTVTLYDGATVVGLTTSSSQGAWIITPAGAFSSGTHVITAIASDSFGNISVPSKPLNVTVDLNSPTISFVPNQTAFEDSGTMIIPFTVGDAETDAAALNVTVQSSNLTLTPSAKLVLEGSGVNRRLSVTPSPEENGSATITLNAVDQSGNALGRSFLLTITPVNDVPFLAPINNVTIPEGAEFRFATTARDVDGDLLTYSLEGAPVGATIDALTGVLSWTPSESQGPGSYAMTVRVADPSLAGASRSFSAAVLEANTPPILAPVADQTVRFGNLVAITAVATDTDLPANILAFSLGSDAPAGAALDPTTGAFTWTPSLAQAGTTFAITIQVRDSGTPPLTASRTFNVVVAPSNTAPTFSPVAEQIIPEGSPFTLSITAMDTDVPANTITYFLGAGAPAGLTLNSSTGVMNWTPTEAQGPSTNQITVVAVDNGIPPLSATHQFTIIVTETNQAPTLMPVSDQTVEVEQTLRVTLTASDSDVPLNLLTFSLGPGAPAGVTINPSAGEVEWTPTLLQGPSTNRITVMVSDNGAPSLGTNQTFTVIVTRQNQPPALASMPDQTVEDGRELVLTFAATDLDGPTQNLLYSLEPGAPGGATLNETTGVFRWTPTETQAPSTNRLAVRVTDNGVPPLSDTKSFTIVVRPSVKLPPTISQIPNQTTVENTAMASIAFTINDPDTAVTALKVLATSSNPTLIPVDNFVFGGDGTNRTVTITPAKDQIGTASVAVRVEDSSGLSASATFEVVVNALPPMITRQPGNQEVVAGEAAMFSVVASGSGPLSFQWIKDNVQIPGATNSVFVVAAARASDAGTYSVVVGNRGGSTVSVPTALIVQQPVSNVRFDPTTGFQFQLRIPAGKQAIVEASADLVNWVKITPTPLTGTVDIQDAPASPAVFRFYRVVFP